MGGTGAARFGTTKMRQRLCLTRRIADYNRDVGADTGTAQAISRRWLAAEVRTYAEAECQVTTVRAAILRCLEVRLKA